MKDNMVLSVEKLTKSVIRNTNVPELEILHRVDLSVRRGEFISILGPSGSGKTTLLHSISGITKPSGGRVVLLGQDMSHLSERNLARLRRSQISYIFQSYNLLPALPVFDNVVLPRRLAHHSISKNAVLQLLKKLNFTADLNQLPSQLSGGEQQKVAIARALMMHAEIIFADEPTGALDSVSRQLIFTELKKLSDLGVTIVMVTHDIDLAAQTNRALILKDGQIVQEIHEPTEVELLKAMQDKEGVRS